ncbi:MAG: PilZ domain-containing protein [Sedimentisphaerales bacterium]|nr:PilZ domain-containing protein [Sedimentisphaerales bacterium]
MSSGSVAHERRRHPRFRFSWPLFFGYDPNGEMHRGQIVDVSRTGVSFLIEANASPSPGACVLTRFSYPHNMSNMFEMDSYFFWANVVRVDNLGFDKVRVAMELHRHLEMDPVGDKAAICTEAAATA